MIPQANKHNDINNIHVKNELVTSKCWESIAQNLELAAKDNYRENYLLRAASMIHYVCWFGSQPVMMQTVVNIRSLLDATG